MFCDIIHIFRQQQRKRSKAATHLITLFWLMPLKFRPAGNSEDKVWEMPSRWSSRQPEFKLLKPDSLSGANK
jgi:hypothetical protein